MSLVLFLLLFAVVISLSSGLGVEAQGVGGGYVVQPSASSRARRPWIQGPRMLPSSIVSVTFALRQRNIGQIHSLVLQVSDPRSPQYGHYKSLEEIADIVAPLPAQIKKVTSWLHDELGVSSIYLVKSRDFLVFNITANLLETAFNIRMYKFSHKASGREIFRTSDPVHLPIHIAEEVELVLGLTDFFDYNSERAKFRKMQLSNNKQQQSTSSPEILPAVRGSESEILANIRIYCSDGSPATTLPACPLNVVALLVLQVMYEDGETNLVNSPVDSEHCLASSGSVTCELHTEVRPYHRVNLTSRVIFENGSSSPWGSYGTVFSPAPWVSPQMVYQMYGIPEGYRGSAHNNNSQSVVAFEKEYISLDDLRNFFTYAGLPQETPTIVGPNDPTNPGGEATLDIQWIMAIGAGVPTVFWSVGGSGPTHDGGAYILTWALQIADTSDPPLVTSISYGDTEQGFFDKFGNYDYINRMNDELAKMSLRGLTVIAGSGDAGASNVGEDGNDISDTDPTCTPLRPFFPSNSPYVVSVSSTFPSVDSLPVCRQSFHNRPLVCSQVGEVAVSVRQGTHWTTGGGFSNLAPTQSWQKDAVSKFLNVSQGHLPPAEYWNSSGRAYPDVSTVGFNLFMVLGGSIVPVGGTSASGPILGGMFALLNDLRLSMGGKPIGLVTPTLYALQSDQQSVYFRDIVVGENFDGDLQVRSSPYPIYCPYGFTTQVGWDAVTGLGTPIFNFLADYFRDS